MRDVSQYLASLRKQGYVTAWSRNGHVKVYSPDGSLVTVASGTPSDRRSVRNLRARVRRAAREPAAAEGTASE